MTKFNCQDDFFHYSDNKKINRWHNFSLVVRNKWRFFCSIIAFVVILSLRCNFDRNLPDKCRFVGRIRPFPSVCASFKCLLAAAAQLVHWSALINASYIQKTHFRCLNVIIINDKIFFGRPYSFILTADCAFTMMGRFMRKFR